MKIKTSQKILKEGYKNIICIGYCNIQYLLNLQEPRYYGSGVYGWNWDGYEIDRNTLIVTGYRPFGNIRPDWRIQKKYEDKAYKIWNNNLLSHEEVKNKMNELLQQFIKEVI